MLVNSSTSIESMIKTYSTKVKDTEGITVQANDYSSEVTNSRMLVKLSYSTAVEFLKKDGMAVLEWLVRLLKESFHMELYLWTGVVHV